MLPHLGNVRLEDLTPERVERWAASDIDPDRRMANRTREKTITVFHGVMERARKLYQDELVFFFATAADELDRDWPDPAKLGPDVTTMSASKRATARTELLDAQQIAERAIWLEDSGQERGAVEEWRKLFESRMPQP